MSETNQYPLCITFTFPTCSYCILISAPEKGGFCGQKKIKTLEWNAFKLMTIEV